MNPEILNYYTIRLLGIPFSELDEENNRKIKRGYIFEGIKYYEKEPDTEKMKDIDVDQSIRILDTWWCNTVGFILAENVKTKKQTVRVGSSCNGSEGEDALHILDLGTSIFLEQARSFFHDKIIPENYVTSSDGLEDWYEENS